MHTVLGNHRAKPRVKVRQMSVGSGVTLGLWASSSKNRPPLTERAMADHGEMLWIFPGHHVKETNQTSVPFSSVPEGEFPAKARTTAFSQG